MTPTKPILPLNACIVVVGSGGREAAMARRLRQDSPERVVIVVPGREGCITGSEPLEGRSLLEVCLSLDGDLYVIGPEQPMVDDDLAGELRARGKLVVGPNADGAQLEGSKSWMKDLLLEAHVPTARYKSFAPGQEDEAEAYIRSTAGPWVIKTDYLMGGKGVLVTSDLDEAVTDARAKLSKGGIVIEEALQGREFSVFAIADGTTAVCIGSAQDYKYLIKDGVSHMTGGVGSYAPVDWVTDELMARVMDECILPTLAALKARGINYRGFLYWGGMHTDDGAIMTLEYNIRLGDPEAQVVLPRIIGDIGQMLYEAAHGQLTSPVLLDDRAAVCVVACGSNYPTASQLDALISWQSGVDYDGEHAYRLHAGTREAPHAMIATDGGRVLNFVGLGSRVSTARRRAYKLARSVEWDGMVLPDYIAAEAVNV
jgi:phosphoribosylamine--glycine ligase